MLVFCIAIIYYKMSMLFSISLLEEKQSTTNTEKEATK